MKKLVKILALVIFVAVTLMGSVSAIDEKIQIPTIYEDTYVYDQGNFIGNDKEKEVNHFLDQLEEQTTIEFAVITIDSLNDLTIEQYSNKLFNTLGIGKKDKNNGILLLISKSDSRVRLEIGNRLTRNLNRFN